MDKENVLSSSNVLVGSIAAGISFILILGHFYYKHKFSFWKKRGLTGPKPMPIIGNLREILYSKSRTKIEKEWSKKYGKVYGIYHGTKPRLVVADAEVLKQICIKDFDNFPNHHRSDFLNKYQKKFLIFLQDEHWKKVRALMSPTFTSGKIKKMFKFLDYCADDLVDCFREQLTNEVKPKAVVNAKDLYSLFTMDAIATCCYGLKLDRAGSANLKSMSTRNEFVKIGMRLFNFNFLRLLVSLVLPNPILVYFNFSLQKESRMKDMAQKVEKMIANRRNSAKKFDDYLQLLIDARIDDNLELNEMDLKENHHAGLTKESLLEDQQKMVQLLKEKNQKVELTDLEIIAAGSFLLLVGLETTGSLLTSCTYALAFHQDIQKKLYDELMKIAEFNEDKTRISFNYDDLTSCQYLDAVISESLRFSSPVFNLDRVSKQDYFIEKYNLHIPKDTVINLAFYAILNDSDYWEEPEVFKPERFFPENKEKIVPGSYCPFGIGPRHCIGMRFSLTEAKLALAKIVTSFHISPAPGTVFPPASRFHPVMNGLKNPLVNIEPMVHQFQSN